MGVSYCLLHSRRPNSLMVFSPSAQMLELCKFYSQIGHQLCHLAQQISICVYPSILFSFFLSTTPFLQHFPLRETIIDVSKPSHTLGFHQVAIAWLLKIFCISALLCISIRDFPSLRPPKFFVAFVSFIFQTLPLSVFQSCSSRDYFGLE